MKFEDFVTDNKNKVWSDKPKTVKLEHPLLLGPVEPLPAHVFWMHDDEGMLRRATWTEEGQIVFLKGEYGWGGD